MNAISIISKLRWLALMYAILTVALCFPIRTQAILQVEGANSSFATIDLFVESEMIKSRIPGLALAIVQDDRIVHLAGFGVAGPDGEVVTPQTPFIIGSVSKSFTSLAVMQLVEAGKIELDAPVERYLPWFHTVDLEATAQITVNQLLDQTSGLPESAGQRSLADEYTAPDALEREVRSYQDIKFSRPPGSTMQYSNANFNILGLIVQAVSEMPYENYVQEHIFEPLRMENSFTSISEAKQYGLATGYRKWFGLPVPAHNLPFPRGHIPSGYLISSAEDLGHYLIAQLNGGRYQDQMILSEMGMALQHQPGLAAPQTDTFKAVGCDNRPGAQYAMGWWSLELNGIPVICHSGDTPDFHADVVLIPEGKWGVAVLMNVSNKLMSEDIHSLIAGVTGLLMDKQPIQEKPDLFSRILLLSLIGVIVFEVLASIRVGLRLFSNPVTCSSNVSRHRLMEYQLYRPLLFSMIGSSLILIGLPLLMGFPWRFMFLNQPDFSGMLFGLALLIILRGVLRSWHNLREVN